MTGFPDFLTMQNMLTVEQLIAGGKLIASRL